jgi:hypothetical protein
MPFTRRSFLAVSAGALGASRGLMGQSKPRLARKDSFFGIHFDLHPNPRDKALGRDLSDSVVEKFLAAVAPDYVQYDCKGHVGYLGYPSQVSTPAPNIVNDSLAIWRRVTARHGVALYVHFSGLWDSLAIEQRPEWAVIRADGTRDPNATSPFSSYVNERMIPQLEEVSAKYDLDGAWIDGECWATRPDYGEAAAKAFTEATGISPLPKAQGEKGWVEFLDFHREHFRKYLRNYLAVMHRSRPKFQIASNWMYTTYVPEKPDIDVDYISGDYLGNAAISAARLETRYLSAVGKPWDLMAWGFVSARGNLGHIHKPAVQIQQEASIVLGQGGGFQVYYQPTRTGHLDDRRIQTMAETARFCRARQALCHQSERVPQIGVLFSRRTLYRTGSRLFGGWGAAVNPARGIVDALLESHFLVDVIPDWQIENLAQFPCIVLPDWADAGAEVRDALLAYARGGGRLLVVGAPNATLFGGDALGLRLAGGPITAQQFITGDKIFGNAGGLWQPVEPQRAERIEDRYPAFDDTRDAACAATLVSAGTSGRIAAIYGPLGESFAVTHAPATREFLRRIVTRIYDSPLKVSAPPTVECALRRKGPDTVLHFTNCTGMQVASEYAGVDYIALTAPIELSITLPKRPAAVTREPGGQPLKGSWSSGRWSGTMPPVHIHEMLRFRMG